MIVKVSWLETVELGRLGRARNRPLGGPKGALLVIQLDVTGKLVGLDPAGQRCGGLLVRIQGLKFEALSVDRPLEMQIAKASPGDVLTVDRLQLTVDIRLAEAGPAQFPSAGEIRRRYVFSWKRSGGKKDGQRKDEANRYRWEDGKASFHGCRNCGTNSLHIRR